jgi:hypothetical protein
VPIESAEIDLRATFPNASKYGLDESGASAMEGLSYVLDVRSSAAPDRVRRVVERAERDCHAANSLRVPTTVAGTLRLNDEVVPFTLPEPPELRR